MSSLGCYRNSMLCWLFLLCPNPRVLGTDATRDQKDYSSTQNCNVQWYLVLATSLSKEQCLPPVFTSIACCRLGDNTNARDRETCVTRHVFDAYLKYKEPLKQSLAWKEQNYPIVKWLSVVHIADVSAALKFTCILNTPTSFTTSITLHYSLGSYSEVLVVFAP